jgi:hypothetical protein
LTFTLFFFENLDWKFWFEHLDDEDISFLDFYNEDVTSFVIKDNNTNNILERKRPIQKNNKLKNMF